MSRKVKITKVQQGMLLFSPADECKDNHKAGVPHAAKDFKTGSKRKRHTKERRKKVGDVGHIKRSSLNR